MLSFYPLHNSTGQSTSLRKTSNDGLTKMSIFCLCLMRWVKFAHQP